jgi:hypothetical protein
VKAPRGIGAGIKRGYGLSNLCEHAAKPAVFDSNGKFLFFKEWRLDYGDLVRALELASLAPALGMAAGGVQET